MTLEELAEIEAAYRRAEAGDRHALAMVQTLVYDRWPAIRDALTAAVLELGDAGDRRLDQARG